MKRTYCGGAKTKVQFINLSNVVKGATIIIYGEGSSNAVAVLSERGYKAVLLKGSKFMHFVSQIKYFRHRFL